MNPITMNIKETSKEKTKLPTANKSENR